MRRWRAENRDKIRAADRRWKAENPDKVRATNRRWRAENSEKERAHNHRWRTENPERARVHGRRWRAENPERVRAYRRRAENRFAEYRRRAGGRALAFELSEAEFITITEQPCHYCGRPGRNGVDRKDSDLGYSTANVLPCCGQCNRAKYDMPYDEFLMWLDQAAMYRLWNCG
jgi:hypothetical protein